MQVANVLITGEFVLDNLEIQHDPKDVADNDSPMYQISNAICVVTTQMRIIFARLLTEVIRESQGADEEGEGEMTAMDADPLPEVVTRERTQNRWEDAGTICGGAVCRSQEDSGGRLRATLPHGISGRSKGICQKCYVADIARATFDKVTNFAELHFSGGAAALVKKWVAEPPLLREARVRLIQAYPKGMRDERVRVLLRMMGLRWREGGSDNGVSGTRPAHLNHTCECASDCVAPHETCKTICTACLGFLQPGALAVGTAVGTGGGCVLRV